MTGLEEFRRVSRDTKTVSNGVERKELPTLSWVTLFLSPDINNMNVYSVLRDITVTFERRSYVLLTVILHSKIFTE